MSLQKEKDLAPQKKNLKHKRESEASGPKAGVHSKLIVGPKGRTSGPEIHNSIVIVKEKTELG